MATLDSQYSGVSQQTIRDRLGGLVTDGITRVNIATNAGELLELDIVCSAMPTHDAGDEDAVEVAQAEALTKVLKLAVVSDRIPYRPHRRILKFVLPLKDKYLGEDVKTRREAAGIDIATGQKPIKPESIRTYYPHEPQALDELARVLVSMEAVSRKEPLPSSSAGS
jgi:hypothetical protein